MQLENRVVLVTGGASGIGLAYVRRLLAEGANVAVADLDVTGLSGVAADSARLSARIVDVRVPVEVDRFVDSTVERFGRLDVLVNNAALFTTLERRPFEELSTADWERVLAVNVIGAFHCAKAAARPMKRQGSGKIINIASNVVHKGLPMLLHYVASKGAIVAMTRALARELGPSGIHVNAIAPGYVMHEGTAAGDAGRNDQVVRLRALARTETPEDLCGALVFLASADSDFISGQTLVVDGGEVFA